MVIEGGRGVINMPVWAHYVLGLTMLVTGAPKGDEIFGTGQAALVVDMGNASISGKSCLMSSSDEIRLSIERNQTSPVFDIDACLKTPALAYARSCFELSYLGLDPAALGDMICITGALAILHGPKLRSVKS